MRRPTRIAAAALALLAAAAGPPPEQERMVPGERAGFVADGAGGCWVWAGGIRAGAEAVRATWTGPCPAGPAEGRGRAEIHWREGDRERAMVFDGTLQRGRAEGQGRFTSYIGKDAMLIQEGRFHEDLFVEGRVRMPFAELDYYGGWLLGHPNGQGRAVIGGRRVLEGRWVNGCLRTPRGWTSFTRDPRECEGRDT